MLTKRTNLLFEEDLWLNLVTLAEQKKTSVGELVRQAVRLVYLDKSVNQKRMAAWKKILETRPRPYPGRIDYKELINHGRRY